MSGQTVQSPYSLDTTVSEVGLPDSGFTPISMQTVIDSLSGVFGQTPFTTSQILTQVQRGTILPFTATSPLTLTIPTNASVSLPINVMFGVISLIASTSTLQILGQSGVTVNSNSSNPTTPFVRGAASPAWMWQQAANVWYVWGDLL